jgi:methanogenic corrinoid protein MtbC1
MALDLQRAALLAFLARGDSRSAERLVDDMLAGGVCGADLHAEMIAPALIGIGDLWARGKVTIGEEHLASAICDHLLRRIACSLEKSPAGSRPRLLLACPEAEQHDLGLTMAADVLQAAGHEVILLGAAAPAEGIVGMAKAHRVAAVGLSVVSPNSAVSAVPVLREMERLRLPVVVGGDGAPRAFDRLPGVTVVRDVRDGLGAFTRLLDRPSMAA